MPVRVYFPEVPIPKEYTKAVVRQEGGSIELQDGSVTVRDYGVHVQKDHQESIFPWTIVREVELHSR